MTFAPSLPRADINVVGNPRVRAVAQHPRVDHRGGIAVASCAWVGVSALSLAMLTMTGCITTRGFDCPPPPNTPPSVETTDTSPRPLSRIVTFDLDNRTGPDGGLPEIQFEVVVRDTDGVAQDHCKVWLNFQPGQAAMFDRQLTPDPGVSTRAHFSFTLPTTSLTAGSCARLELRVSSAFRPEPLTHEPVDANDIGTAVWWIAPTSSSTQPSVDMTACP